MIELISLSVDSNNLWWTPITNNSYSYTLYVVQKNIIEQNQLWKKLKSIEENNEKYFNGLFFQLHLLLEGFTIKILLLMESIYREMLLLVMNTTQD